MSTKNFLEEYLQPLLHYSRKEQLKKCYKVKKNARGYLTTTQVEVHYLPAVLCNVPNA
jgi:hypothetical protein